MSVRRNLKKMLYGALGVDVKVDRGEFISFTDDDMFCSVMEDEETCKEFLHRVLGIEIAEIKCVISQKHIRNRIVGRGIRLDVYVKDIENNIYNIEMQTTVDKEIALRTRYYHSEMDGYQIRKGARFADLGNNIVIFVCTYDPFEENRSIYTFKKYCSEDKSIELNDKITSIFLNVTGDRAGVDGKLVNLLDYINTGESHDEYTEALSKRVLTINEDDDWRDRHMTLEMKLEQQREIGIELGKEIGMELGKEQGRKREIFQSVQDGDYDAMRGASKLNMDVEDFKCEMYSAGYNQTK